MRVSWITKARDIGMTTKRALGKDLERALKDRDVTVEQLAERTKVPRGTIAAFLDEPGCCAALPELVYLKGHLRLVCRELGLDPEDHLEELEQRFAAAKPEVSDEPRRARWWANSFTRTTAAGVGALALLMMVMAAASSIG